MASELYVETLKGLTSGANANKVIVPAGQTLDASAGDFLPASGQIIQQVTATTTGELSLTADSWTSLITVSITPKVANSILLFQCEAVRLILGIGSAEGRVRFQDGTNVSVQHRLVNFDTSFAVSYNPTFTGSIAGTHSAGASLTVGVYATRQSGSATLTFGDSGSTSRLLVWEMMP